MIIFEFPSFTLQNLPCFQETCTGYVQIWSNLKPLRSGFLFFEYFTYPKPDVLFILPPGGPQSGGTSVKVVVRDFYGEQTKQGVGMQTFSDVVFRGATLIVEMECSSSGSTSSPAVVNPTIASSTNPGMTGFIDISLAFKAPQSPPCDQDSAHIRFSVFPSGCGSRDCSWQPGTSTEAYFAYRAPGI